MRGLRYVFLFTITLGFSSSQAQCDTLIPNFNYTESWYTVIFTDVSSGNIIHWLWDFGDGSSDTIQHPIHLYQFETTYTVCLTVHDSCMDSSMHCNDINIGGIIDTFPIGIQQNPFLTPKLYPNPAIDYFQVETKERLKMERISLFDIHGREVKKYLNVLSRQKLLVNDQVPGMYFIEILIQQKLFYSRLIIE